MLSDPVRFARGPYDDVGLIDWDLSVGPTGAAVFEWVDELFPELHAAYRPAAMAAWSKPIAPPGATSTENLATTVDSKLCRTRPTERRSDRRRPEHADAAGCSTRARLG